MSARFGEVERIVRTDWASATRPEIIQISNMRNDAGERIGGLGSGELDWHTDQSYHGGAGDRRVPLRRRAAARGRRHVLGQPADRVRGVAGAHQAEDRGTPRRLQLRRAGQGLRQRVKGYDEDRPTPEEVRKHTPDVTHPLVHTHPVTGRKALYLDPSTMTGIEGMDEAEGRALLDELNRHATREEFVYRHRWQPGDLVMWDNGFLIHRRDPYDPAQNRLMKRTTIRLSPERHIVPR